MSMQQYGQRHVDRMGVETMDGPEIDAAQSSR